MGNHRIGDDECTLDSCAGRVKECIRDQSVFSTLTDKYFTTIVTDPSTLKLGDPFNNAAPNLKPQTGSPLLTGAKFDFGTLNDAFFEKVAYKGALDGVTDWTSGWAVFNK